MALYPPDDPFLFNFVLFGIPIVVRWYGVLIMSGALIAANVSARRGQRRGVDPDHVWNQLMIGLIISIICARIYYVAFEWERFAGDPLSMLNITTGGIAIHGAIIGALLSGVIYTRLNKIDFWKWVDICMPTFLIAQGIGRWGNFFNQEAYGRPTELGFGVRIDPQFRLPPYTDLAQYPVTTLFHATFLYESLWNILGGIGLLVLDRRIGAEAPAGKRRLRSGDLFFLYLIIYSLGRIWIEGLRLDSLCANGIGGECFGSFRVAQWASLAMIAIGIIALIVNHRSSFTGDPDAPVIASNDLALGSAGMLGGGDTGSATATFGASPARGGSAKGRRDTNSDGGSHGGSHDGRNDSDSGAGNDSGGSSSDGGGGGGGDGGGGE